MYSVLTIAYSQFYGALGVNPVDVGLSYLNTLTGSVGAVLAFLLLLALAAAALFIITFPFVFIVTFVSLVREFRSKLSKDSSSGEAGDIAMAMVTLTVATLLRSSVAIALFAIFFRIAGIRKTTAKVTMWGTLVVAMLLVAYALPATSSAAAGHVRDTEPVLAPRLPILPVSLLAFQAAPVTIEPTGKPDETKTVNALKRRSLLYLGQSGGIVVFYDGSSDEAVYVPASSVVLEVSNCHTKDAAHPACKQLHEDAK